MAKQANRMMIGAFVVVAAAIGAVSLVIFGAGGIFKKTHAYVMYFDGSIKGLNVGAPVLFQGVPIGSVTSIVINTLPDEQKARIPVTVEIDPEKFRIEKGGVRKDPRENLPKLIDAGLRAVLATQSFITGQLMIEVDFYPDTPVDLKHYDDKHPEIPTIPSTTQKLVQTFQNLDLSRLEEKMEGILEGIERFINNPDLSAAVHSLKEAAEELHVSLKNLDDRTEIMTTGIDETLADVRKLLGNMDRQIEPVADNLNRTLESYEKLSRNADSRVKSLSDGLETTLADTRGVISKDASFIVQMENMVGEISEAARSIGRMADYLERHPEALLRGKANYSGN